MTTQNRIAITGNTFPVKEALKALGAKWNPDRKAWMVTADKATEAQAIVAGAARSFGRRSFDGCSACKRSATGWCRSCAFDEFDN